MCGYDPVGLIIHGLLKNIQSGCQRQNYIEFTMRKKNITLKKSLVEPEAHTKNNKKDWEEAGHKRKHYVI